VQFGKSSLTFSGPKNKPIASEKQTPTKEIFLGLAFCWRFKPEDGGNIFLRNIDELLSYYIVSYFGRDCSSLDMLTAELFGFLPDVETDF
jgi:hypothetical protein